MDDTAETVGTYDTLYAANLAAAKYFMAEYSGWLQYAQPEYTLKENGTVCMDIEAEGSMGGLASVYVREVAHPRGGG